MSASVPHRTIFRWIARYYGGQLDVSAVNLQDFLLRFPDLPRDRLLRKVSYFADHLPEEPCL